jgi:hypothetical protein
MLRDDIDELHEVIEVDIDIQPSDYQLTTSDT